MALFITAKEEKLYKLPSLGRLSGLWRICAVAQLRSPKEQRRSRRINMERLLQHGSKQTEQDTKEYLMEKKEK